MVLSGFRKDNKAVFTIIIIVKTAFDRTNLTNFPEGSHTSDLQPNHCHRLDL